MHVHECTNECRFSSWIQGKFATVVAFADSVVVRATGYVRSGRRSMHFQFTSSFVLHPNFVVYSVVLVWKWYQQPCGLQPEFAIEYTRTDKEIICKYSYEFMTTEYWWIWLGMHWWCVPSMSMSTNNMRCGWLDFRGPMIEYIRIVHGKSFLPSLITLMPSK